MRYFSLLLFVFYSAALADVETEIEGFESSILSKDVSKSIEDYESLTESVDHWCAYSIAKEAYEINGEWLKSSKSAAYFKGLEAKGLIVISIHKTAKELKTIKQKAVEISQFLKSLGFKRVVICQSGSGLPSMHSIILDSASAPTNLSK